MLFAANGAVVNSAIDGCIQMKSYLSGNPELKLALNSDLVIGKGTRGDRGMRVALVLALCVFLRTSIHPPHGKQYPPNPSHTASHQNHRPDQGATAGYGSVVLDDCNFHECVRLDEFESSRTLTFLPPDGEFALLNYRVTGEFRCPFRIFPSVEEVAPYKVGG